ncbi:MAG: glucose-6-phosphate isomerase [Verrucomicrobiota bacterium]
MNFPKQQLWERFQKYYTEFPTLGLSLDLSRINLDDAFIASMQSRLKRAFATMTDLEAGAIANPDEGRMVGHYWLRNPALAATPEIRLEIEKTLVQVQAFATDVHAGVVRGTKGAFKNYLLIGIGGSALGPQFIANALGNPVADKLRPHFLDNTDPQGIRRVLTSIGADLGQTLCLVISKSGETKETKNGMLVTKDTYEEFGLDFGKHALAVTKNDSSLDIYAAANRWLKRFPMWDWVGGRTSVMSAVGLLPAALQGINTYELLAGAKACDDITRRRELMDNPAAQLALAWFRAGDGAGKKNMVVLPYRDCLELLPRYLQQLVMESIGKKLDLLGNIVHQGITVLGNKGATDQHSYIQHVIDGVDNSFVTFINALSDQDDTQLFVDDEITPGDFLQGFFLGTRQALSERGRESISITLRTVTPFSIGVLIALFERAVGYYASLVGVNAYHQPGVESGKRVASMILDLQMAVLNHLTKFRGVPLTATQLASAIGMPTETEHVFRICEHLSANPSRGVKKFPANSWLNSSYLKF